MRDTVRFFINHSENIGGPSIFGYRLRRELTKQGWRWSRFIPCVSYIFSSGFFRPFCKNILRLDGLYFDSENTIADSDRLNRPIFKAYKKADGVIFQSAFNQLLFNNFIGEAPCPQIVICNGVPSDFCTQGEKVEYDFKKTIVCSAKWRAHKRLDSIIEGFLEYDNPEVGLVIIGAGFEKPIIHPNIKFIGKVATNEMPKYLRGGDAFIHLAWVDHCPNTVVEALSCGLPVLCSHNGGTKEIVRSNGIVIQCEEDYDFKKVALYNPPKCDKKKVAAGIEDILKWNKPIVDSYLRIEHIADKYMDFTLRILGR
jgi:glycosyltransferase involved in cell wall biosynthesis